jgi:DNA-directed RNA polymerase subunit RPC12/RpoP
MEPLVVWECFDCAYQMTTDAEEPMEECDRCGSKAIYVIGEVRDDD